MLRSPVVIPGVTTVERTHGTTAGSDPEKLPLDLYLGVDCSGSMTNPAHGLSYPVLAGTVLLLSALRTGARAKVCLSGESPGRFSENPDFTREQRALMTVLTGYLGTGYAFGIQRLADTFLPTFDHPRPVHILIVSDSDIFMMLDRTPDGWELARQALENAGGGGTMALELRYRGHDEGVKKLRDHGWEVEVVSDMKSLVAFARGFARRRWGEEERT